MLLLVIKNLASTPTAWGPSAMTYAWPLTHTLRIMFIVCNKQPWVKEALVLSKGTKMCQSLWARLSQAQGIWGSHGERREGVKYCPCQCSAWFEPRMVPGRAAGSPGTGNQDLWDHWAGTFLPSCEGRDSRNNSTSIPGLPRQNSGTWRRVRL